MKKSQIISMLERYALRYCVLPIGEAHEIVVMERGGRVFGPFAGADGEGLFWTPALWESEEAFGKFLREDVWNIGGDRIWVAPEIQFSVSDRNRYWETLKTPSAIDPGSYRLSAVGDAAELSQSMQLQAAVIAEGKVSLQMQRSIRPARNPLEALPDADALMEQVSYCGYTQSIRMEADGDPGVGAAAWSLLQVVPEGNVYIPMYTPCRAVNYYEPVGELETLHAQGAVLRVTGSRRYKTGYKAALLTGRFAYASRVDGACCLLLRNYPNDPSNAYNEEPPALTGENGFSVHVYNDDGAAGGFAEIECNLLNVEAAPGLRTTQERISTWIYLGAEDRLRAIGKKLLGFEDIRFD